MLKSTLFWHISGSFWNPFWLVVIRRWLGHGRNTSHEYITNFWVHLPLAILSSSLDPTLFPLQTARQLIPTLVQTILIFLPNHLCTKTNTSSNSCFWTIISFAYMILIKHISKTPLVTSRHLPKSYPILAPNQPRILLELPSFVPKYVPTLHQKILDSLRCAPTTGLD